MHRELLDARPERPPHRRVQERFHPAAYGSSRIERVDAGARGKYSWRRSMRWGRTMAETIEAVTVESDRRVEALRRAVDDAVQQRRAATFTLVSGPIYLFLT